MLVSRFDTAFAAVQQQLLATQGKEGGQGQPTPAREPGVEPAVGRAASGPAGPVAHALVATVKRQHNHRREVERKLAQFRNDPNALARFCEATAKAAAVRSWPLSHALEAQACSPGQGERTWQRTRVMLADASYVSYKSCSARKPFGYYCVGIQLDRWPMHGPQLQRTLHLRSGECHVMPVTNACRQIMRAG